MRGLIEIVLRNAPIIASLLSRLFLHPKSITEKILEGWLLGSKRRLRERKSLSCVESCFYFISISIYGFDSCFTNHLSRSACSLSMCSHRRVIHPLFYLPPKFSLEFPLLLLFPLFLSLFVLFLPTPQAYFELDEGAFSIPGCWDKGQIGALYPAF